MKEDSKELKRPKRIEAAVTILTAGIETRIKKIADEVGGAQKLADMLGVHVTQVYRYMNGENQPTINIAARMAAAGRVSIDWLATGNQLSSGVREETPSYQAHGVNTGMLTQVVAAVEELISEQALSININKRAELIAVAYRSTIATGKLDTVFIAELLQLTRS